MAYTPLDRPWETVLDMDSAAGLGLSNAQVHQVMPNNQIAACRSEFDKEYPHRKERTTNPTSIYNCHGLVFAARRTGIDDPALVRRILQEDQYKKIQDPSQVLAGDIVVYVVNGDIEHSGIVVTPPSESPLGLPKIVSKWGPYVEVLHYVHQCPYDSTVLEYYRVDRA